MHPLNMTPRSLAPLLACLAAAVLLLPGCSAPAPSLYKLSAEGPPPTSGGIGIGVGPVTTADYLSRPNLFLQEGGHKLVAAESHRWAGDLDDNITAVLAANLGRELRTSHVLTYPWTGDAGLRYQIALDIRELHGHADGHAVLHAAWRVYALPARTLVTTRTWTATEPLNAYEELVAAESRLLARLAGQIGAGLR